MIATGHYARIALLPRLNQIGNLPDISRDVIPIDPRSPYAWQNSVLHSHYRPVLLTARDQSKDQSYFLSTVREEHLRQFIFPLGDFKKSDIKDLAGAPSSPLAGTNVLRKKESMGVCFIGKVYLT